MSAKPCPDCNGPRGYLAGCTTCGGMGNLYTPPPQQPVFVPPLALLRGGGDKPDPAPTTPESADVIARLEDLLAKAKAGKVQALVALIVTEGEYQWTMSPIPAVRALGFIEIMKHKLLLAVEEDHS